jgi:hypothetical protein
LSSQSAHGLTVNDEVNHEDQAPAHTDMLRIIVSEFNI